ncbi:MAG: stage III sporulation protein AF [Syntrophomonadaceae bacterium]|nr:stage III sporulation protein AF [Syntrophomonadaceae bacterium]
MTTIYEIVRNLLVIIVIASFLELILPDGKLRPFVRFSVGLFILIAILSPTLKLLFTDKSFELGFWDYQLDAGIERSVREQGEELSRKVYQPRQDEIQTKLQGQINAISSLVPGVNTVQSQIETDRDGSVKKITLQIDTGSPSRIEKVAGVKVFSAQPQPIDADGEEVIADKITQLISNLYEIPMEKVEINFGGG